MWRTRRCARQRSHCAKGEGSAPRGHEPRLSYYPPARKRFPKIIQTIRRKFQRLFRRHAPPSQPMAFPHGKAGHHPLPMSRAQLHGRANFKAPIAPSVSSPSSSPPPSLPPPSHRSRQFCCRAPTTLAEVAEQVETIVDKIINLNVPRLLFLVAQG